MDYESFYKRIDFAVLTEGPKVEWTEALVVQCQRVLRAALAAGTAAPERCGVRPWVFLEYLVKRQGYLLHGSQQKEIAIFEPRIAANAFKEGKSPRVYASSSGILAMWYAIVDRGVLRKHCNGWENYGMIYAPYDLRNDTWVERFHFSVAMEVYEHFPFSAGVVYVLPREPFQAEYLQLQWYAEQAVRPLLRVPVTPEDWPMLKTVSPGNFPNTIRWLVQTQNPVPAVGNPDLCPVLPEPQWKRRLTERWRL